LTSDITSLNPYDSAGESTSVVLTQLYASLFKEYDGEVVPAIAEGMEASKDGTSVTITLREGSAFSDGSPITPEDVAFSLEQAKEGGTIGTLYAQTITSQEAKGDSQVVLQLERPVYNLDALLSYTEAAIIPADFGGRSKEEFFQEPLAAGPFAFDTRRPGTSISLVRNENFWESDKPYLDGLDFEVFNSVNALTSAFQAGTVQAVPFAPRESVPSFSSANVVNTAASSTELVFVNGETGPLQEAKVRQAISVAIDRENIVAQLGGEGDEPTTTYLPPSVLGDAEPAPVEAADPERAKELLTEASYGDGVTIELMYPTGDATLANTVQAIQENLKGAGIALDVQALDLGAWVDRLLSGDYELAYQSISGTGTTPETALAFYIESKAIGGGWSTDVAEETLRNYQEATDAAEQAEALNQFQAWVSAELPVIPTVSVRPALVLDPNVGGFEGLGAVRQQVLPLEELWLVE
jgi:ABC-type transport system substrate-binding protein